MLIKLSLYTFYCLFSKHRFHPKYKPYAKFPDISLVQANRRIKFESGTVSPICLPYKNFVDTTNISPTNLMKFLKRFLELSVKRSRTIFWKCHNPPNTNLRKNSR